VIPPSVKAGDRVLLPGWGGNSIKLGEEVHLIPLFLRRLVLTPSSQEYFLFKDSEILAKIKE
jgi:chaperonin GroES